MSNPLYEAIRAIETARPRRIVVLTGAGISAESGIPTFRGQDGLWEGFRAEDLATPEAFSRDPERVWRWYEWRRDLIRRAEPNRAHEALASLDRVSGDRSSLVITQNVDGLHRRAGSSRLVELHGNLFQVRCVAEQTIQPADDPFTLLPPRCQCGALLRPHVVWFGEMLDPSDLERAQTAAAAADLLLIVGTSAVVYPAAGLIDLASSLTVEVNPNPTLYSARIGFSIPLPATEAVPLLVRAIVGRES